MADFSHLQSLLTGTLILDTEGSKAYKKELEGYWNGIVRSCRPKAFILAATVEDVLKSVAFCVQNKLQLCVCAAKNCDLSVSDGAIVLDLSPMNSVRVDVERQVAVVGGGAKVQDVDNATVPHCLVTSLGSYSELGVTGLALLGGTGFLSRSFGCCADSVLEFELVTAAGDVIRASKEDNPDLFWGMKGYGANFGVVTSLTFQLYDLPTHVIGGDLRYPMDRAKIVFKAIRDFVRKKADNRLSVYMMIHYTRTRPEALCRFLFNGSSKQGGALLMELCIRTKPTVNQVKPVLFNEFQKRADWLTPRGRLYYAPMGNFVRELTDEGIDIIIDGVNNSPDSRVLMDSNIYIACLGGRIQDIAEDSSPYPFRPAEYWIGVVAATRDAGSYNLIKDWADDIDKKIAKYRVIPDEAAEEKVRSKLKALKLKYDPDNVFHFNFNIDPNA